MNLLMATAQVRTPLSESRREFEETAIPLAIELGVLSAGTTLERLAGDTDQKPIGPTNAKPLRLEARLRLENAALVLKTAYLNLEYKRLRRRLVWLSERRGVAPPELPPDEGEDDDCEPRAIRAVYESIGFLFALSAMLEAQSTSVRRAANGRIDMGKATRSKVRAAAIPHLGKIAKDQAAPLIADRIGKSIGHVRRILASEFPGDSWDDPEAS